MSSRALMIRLTQEGPTMPKTNKADRQARLRTAAAPELEQPTAKPPTRDELYQEAKAAGIKGASKFSRDQLVAALAAHVGSVTLTDAQVEANGTHVVDTPDVSTWEGRQKLGDERIAAAAHHYAETLTDPDAPKPEEDPVKRMMAAKGEQVALKAWQLTGKGDRPSTPNYDYIAATYVAGGEGLMPKTKRQRAASNGSGGGGGTRSKAGARGQAATAERKRLGGNRGTGRKLTDAEFRDYIRTVHAEHPESSMGDEREYAYWCENIALGRTRWAALWDEVVGGGDLDTEAGTDLPPADDVAAQVHEAAKAVAAKKAAPKKATGAKRGDNLRSKAPAKGKDVTPISKEQQTRRRAPAKR